MDSQATDTLERVGVAEGAEPAAADEAPGKAPKLAQSVDPEANIVLRLWRVELDVGAVEKTQTATIKTDDGKTAYTYKFSGYEAVVAAVRAATARHGVKVMPSSGKHERIGNLTVLTMSVDFINVDDPSDKLTVEMTNYGADKGDKGASKALTNVMREAIKKGLGITSVEDDRADETTEFEAHDAGAAKAVSEAKEATGAAIQQWATAFKGALENATTAKEVGRLQADNAQQLNDPAMPSVTRQFFFDLIQRRKAELAEK